MSYVAPYQKFSEAIADVQEGLRAAPLVHTEKWQGYDILRMPHMATYELLHVSFRVPVWTEQLQVLADNIGPNLPWADDHFVERVLSQPLNPGEQYKNWPWGRAAEASRVEGEAKLFSHTYMERYWPKWAGLTTGGAGVPPAHGSRAQLSCPEGRQGIRYAYGDLDDVVTLLAREPRTRQAYLPVWFPEDTGAAHGGRVPCTIGYHFIMREDKLDIVYQLRSCDFVKHFRDDIYLTVRLLLWVLDKLRELDVRWESVMPGEYVMHVTSMHLFRPDYRKLFGREPAGVLRIP